MNIEKQNYKIKVANEVESKEVQELFFELGYFWHKAGKEVLHLGGKYVFTDKDGKITRVTRKDTFVESKKQELTLPQLRDLVVLHRNDVSDATHKHKNIEGEKYYKTCDGNFFHFGKLGKWHYVGSSATNHVVSKHVVPIDQEQPKMTWDDACLAMFAGEEVEVKWGTTGEWVERSVVDGKKIEAAWLTGGWVDIKNFNIYRLLTASAFRIKPKTVFIDAGDYTKEQLLKLAGEMA